MFFAKNLLNVSPSPKKEQKHGKRVSGKDVENGYCLINFRSTRCELYDLWPKIGHFFIAGINGQFVGAGGMAINKEVINIEGIKCVLKWNSE